MAKYDYLIVGCGIYAATFAEIKKRQNKSILIIDKRNHIGGNCYTENKNNIDIHVYGAHIFNTNKKYVWDYINKFIEFNNYKHKVDVNYKNKIYSFPINLKTLKQIFNTNSDDEAKLNLKNDLINIPNPKNMEEWCLSNIGKKLYEIFIKGYSIKQWNKNPKDLPASIIKRLPLRIDVEDNNYYKSQYQGIPKEGYAKLIENMLDGIDVELNLNFNKIKNNWKKYAKNLIYTGNIDAFYDYEYGNLDYRSLRWENKIHLETFQTKAVINYTDINDKFTRVIEHKHFNDKNQKNSIISYEYSENYKNNLEPYYPINNNKNNSIYKNYNKIKLNNILISGRLGKYKYLDMDDTIALAMKEIKII